jgi:hypothetical protein
MGTLYTQNDYDIWRTNFGQTVGDGSSSQAAVPEPTSILLLVVALAMWRCNRSRFITGGVSGGGGHRCEALVRCEFKTRTRYVKATNAIAL